MRRIFTASMLVILSLLSSGCSPFELVQGTLEMMTDKKPYPVADVRAAYADKFHYSLEMPRGWTQKTDPVQGKWEVMLNKVEKTGSGSTIDGIFRVYVLPPAFAKRYSHYWEFLSENVVPRTNVTIPFIPITALKLPVGWEARLTALEIDPGRAVWVAHQEGDLVFVYIFAFDPPVSYQLDEKGNAKLVKAPLFYKNKDSLEYMIAHTSISLRNDYSSVETSKSPDKASSCKTLYDKLGSCAFAGYGNIPNLTPYDKKDPEYCLFKATILLDLLSSTESNDIRIAIADASLAIDKQLLEMKRKRPPEFIKKYGKELYDFRLICNEKCTDGVAGLKLGPYSEFVNECPKNAR